MYITMNYILTILIFIIVMFLYVHIIEHYRKSQDLEIYEMDYVNNQQFQEVCDIKQPVLFEFKQFEPELFDELNLETISGQTKDDIKIIDANDYWKSDIDTIDYIALPFQSGHKLIESDSNSHFFTENNETFMEENGFAKKIQVVDSYFKPYGTVQTYCDLIFGSKRAYTPLRYHTDYRKLICVSSGKIQIKMTPWRSEQYLHPVKDYEKYEFRSPVNVWNTQKQYLHEMDKIKFLEFDVSAGYVFCVPAYWWYSIKYSDEADTCAFVCTYNTVVNCIANSPDIIMYLLQQQNITKKMARIMATRPDNEVSSSSVELNDDASVTDETELSETRLSETRLSETRLSETRPDETTISSSIELK